MSEYVERFIYENVGCAARASGLKNKVTCAGASPGILLKVKKSTSRVTRTGASTPPCLCRNQLRLPEALTTAGPYIGRSSGG